MLQNVQKSTASVLTLLTLTIALSACSTTPRTVEYTPQPIERPTLILPPTETLNMKDVDWIVVTPDNADEYFARMQENGESISFFALTADGYAALGINMAQLLELISQQRAIIVAYEDYYNSVETQLENQDARVIIPVEEETQSLRDRISNLFK